MLGSDMLSAKPASKKVRAAIISHFGLPSDVEVLNCKAVHISCRLVQIGDCVAYRHTSGRLGFGQVYAHVSVSGEALTCVSDWPVSEFCEYFAKCCVQEKPEMISTSSLIESCVFYNASPGNVSQVLFPPRLKQRAGIKLA